MVETTNPRLDRIRRLLLELEYEVTRGIMENEIDEEIGFRFAVPVSRKIPNGAVQAEFRTRPVPAGQAFVGGPPRLRVVEAIARQSPAQDGEGSSHG